MFEGSLACLGTCRIKKNARLRDVLTEMFLKEHLTAGGEFRNVRLLNLPCVLWLPPFLRYPQGVMVRNPNCISSSEDTDEMVQIILQTWALFHLVGAFGQSNSFSQKMPMLMARSSSQGPRREECSRTPSGSLHLLRFCFISQISCVGGSCNAHQSKKTTWRPKSGISDDPHGQVWWWFFSQWASTQTWMS